MPPTQVVIRAPVSAYSQLSSRWTCIASSRVGVTISARGAPAGVNRSLSPSSVRASARPNATVLPEPVCADTRTSRTSTSGAMTAAWTGVGVTKPRAASARRRAGEAEENGKGAAHPSRSEANAQPGVQVAVIALDLPVEPPVDALDAAGGAGATGPRFPAPAP